MLNVAHAVSSRRPTGTRACRRRWIASIRLTPIERMKWEIVIGLETHAQLSTRVEDLLGRVDGVRRGAEHAGSRGRHRAARRAAGAEQGAVERAIRFGLAVGGTINAAHRLRAQELLLSRPSEGLPDQPVRDPGRRGRRASRSSSASAEKRVRLTRAHLEEDAGKSLHEDFHGMTRHRSEPRRHAAARDRVRARHALARPRRSPTRKALHALVRWIGICDGNMQEGSFRCDANVSVRRPGGDARHALRDQEPQLVPLPRAGDRVRGAPADRADRGRRQGRAGDAALRSRPRRDALDAQQGRRAGLPLLPRPGPAAAGDRRRVDRRGASARCRSCRGELRARFETEHGLAAYDADAADRDPREGRVLRARDRRSTRLARQAGGQLGHRRAWRRC